MHPNYVRLLVMMAGLRLFVVACWASGEPAVGLLHPDAKQGLPQRSGA